MSQDRQQLWDAAAAACRALAATLPAGQEPDGSAVESLRNALEQLSGAPDGEPTADFLREAAAAAAAASSLAAGAKCAAADLPPDNEALLRELHCWDAAGAVAATLLRAVFNGCLGSLPVREAYSVCSAAICLTEGLPTALLAAQRQWAQHPQQLAELPNVLHRIAARASREATYLLQTLNYWLIAGQDAAQPASGVQSRLAVARLLRSTAARPALVLAAVDSLAQLVEPAAANSAWPMEQDREQAMGAWLTLAAHCCSLPMCADERARLAGMPDLQRRMADLAAGSAGAVLQPHRQAAAAASHEHFCCCLDSAASVLSSPAVLEHSCPALGLLGVADTGRLVCAALEQLAEALDGEGASQSADAARRALALAAFAAAGLQAAGETARLPLPVDVQAAVESEQPQQPAAIRSLSPSSRVQLMTRLVEQLLQPLPRLLQMVDAMLQQGLWPPAAAQDAGQAADAVAERMRRLCRFLQWLGHASAALAPALSAAEVLPEIATAAGEAWLLVQRRLLQLHTCHSPAAADSDGSGSGGSTRGSSRVGAGGSSSSSSDAAIAVSLERSGCSMRLFRMCLALCSRGLGKLYGELQPHLSRAQARMGQGSRAWSSPDPAAILQPPKLATARQLVTAVCITCHLAAGMGQHAGDAAARRQHLQLLACGDSEFPAACAASMLGFAMTGVHTCLMPCQRWPLDADGRPGAAALEVGRHMGATLLELTSAAAALCAAAPCQASAVAGDAGGSTPGAGIGTLVTSLAVGMVPSILYAQCCGQTAAAVEAEVVLGRAMQQLAGVASASPHDTSTFSSVWATILALKPNLGSHFVVSGALEAALDWAAQPDARQRADLLQPVMQGVLTTLLGVLPELAPLPAQSAPPASGAAVLAAAEQHVQQQLGLDGAGAQAAANTLAQWALNHWALPAAQKRAFLAQALRLGNQRHIVLARTASLRTAWTAMLERLKPLAQQRLAPRSPAVQELALARCAALRRRRCAHLGCTNVPLLLGPEQSSGGGNEARSYKCTGCRAVRFCSEACSRADWRVHKLACRQLAAARAAEPAGGEQEA